MALEVQYSEGCASASCFLFPIPTSRGVSAGGSSLALFTILSFQASEQHPLPRWPSAQKQSGTKEERKAQITQNAADMWILFYSWTNHPWFVFVPYSFHASGLQFWQRASPQLWVLLRGSDISSCRWRNATGPFLRNTVASSGLVCWINGSASLWQPSFSSRNPISLLSWCNCFSLRHRRMRELEGGGGGGGGA